jgi:glycyl-tRNA synthetase
MELLQKIVSLAKRRGFVFPSSEIYGGFGSCYDFGPLGVEMKSNIKKAWWNEMTRIQESVVGLDAAILMSPKIWEASGHLSAGFADELVECKKCKKRFRIDEIKDKCPECGGELTEPRKFNLMMKTFIGPVEEKASQAYLRAETCQGIYVNFKNVLNSMRMKIPFGIAQIGKSFRNEITPRDFIYRTREFEQMEMQWFCHPEKADEFFSYWKEQRMKWYLDLGIKKEKIKFKEAAKEDLAHYAKRAVDIEYEFPFGWREIEGVHYRGDWDLSNHSKNSGQDLSYFDEAGKEKYIPHIIETSAGADRSFFAFLCNAYEEIKGGRTKTTESIKEEEVFLRLHKSLAPVKAAILPLMKNKPEITEKAKEIYRSLKLIFPVQYDEVGSIGKRYRRQDEIGTIFCFTVDFDSLKQNDLTVRYRDTMEQKRISIDEIPAFLEKELGQ